MANRSKKYSGIFQLSNGLWTFEDVSGWLMSAEYLGEIAIHDPAFLGWTTEEGHLRSVDLKDVEECYYSQWMYDTEEEALVWWSQMMYDAVNL